MHRSERRVRETQWAGNGGGWRTKKDGVLHRIIFLTRRTIKTIRTIRAIKSMKSYRGFPLLGVALPVDLWLQAEGPVDPTETPKKRGFSDQGVVAGGF